MSAKLLSELKAVVGEKGYLEGDDVGPKYYSDSRGVDEIVPALVLRPASTEEVSEIMKLCYAAGQRVVVQGGMTGLVEAARPEEGEIPISFERMNKIEELDVKSRTMTVQSGTPLQVIQELADANDLLYPLDLGARGSCTIGGNLATNAGGNRVIRYGMTREQVLGVEAVLADGTIINSLNKLVKNNTGYDLKQLFIGSEGTLGLITRVDLRLTAKPRSQTVAFCAVTDFNAVIGFMQHMQSSLGGNLSAFEVLWKSTYQLISDEVAGIKLPFPNDYEYYVLVEQMGGDTERDAAHFEDALGKALEKEFIVDAVISKSEAEILGLWDIRDGMAEAMGGLSPAVSFDFSLLLENMEEFTQAVERRLCDVWEGSVAYIGGHLGDGNLHMRARAGTLDPQPKKEVNDIVYGLIGELGGSVSAEHGIGTSKRDYLNNSRSPAEIALMQTLKAAMDPKGLLGAGRVFETKKAN